MCSRQYCTGILGYSDKEVQYACVHASTVLGSWDILTRRCSMHVFMPVLSWDGQSILGLTTWYGTTFLRISMPFDLVTGHPSLP